MSLSKLFFEQVTKKNLRCLDIYHPGKSCLQFNLYLLKNTWLHCAKFYAPMALLPLAKKINSLQWTEAKKTLTLYINLILGTLVPSTLTFPLVCFLSNCFGRIYLSTLIYIPNLITTTFYAPFLDQRVATIYGNILLMMNLEVLIREGRTSFWRLLRDSKWTRTVLFMVSSSIIIDTMSSMPTNIFWFIDPCPKKVFSNKEFADSPTTSNNCNHKHSCVQHIWRITKHISMTMIGFEALRVILTNIRTIAVNPLTVTKILLNKMNFPLVVMVSGYTSIFHISKCIQNRLHRTPLSSPASRYSNLISGFLCGSVFWLNPDVTLLCHGLSAAIQLTFQNYFLNWLTSKNKSITNCAANFPWSKVVFMIATGYVMHLVILYPSLCSKFMHKMSDTIVSRRFREVRKHVFGALIQ